MFKWWTHYWTMLSAGLWFMVFLVGFTWTQLPDTEHGKFLGGLVGALLAALVALAVVQINLNNDSKKSAAAAVRLRHSVWLEVRLIARAMAREHKYWEDVRDHKQSFHIEELSEAWLQSNFISTALSQISVLRVEEQRGVILVHDNLCVVREMIREIRAHGLRSKDLEQVIEVAHAVCWDCDEVMSDLDPTGEFQRLWNANPRFSAKDDQEFRMELARIKATRAR